ncbi:hypothetical protein KPH14_003448 [Odynerus spinipes]|uniref:Uncharacterized protein n=1 Tax=Odynerus spinipes TaxID=1348599 RepID=A0AAD9RCN1_9HYME|nr:hypothetical protein KPH14_003448 [Odynerus spinipes]
MKFCVSCVCWALFLTLFVSSWLLFLIVASENTEGRTPSVPSERDGDPNVFENVTADIESEENEVPEIVIARVQNSKIENEFLEESTTKVSSSFDTINTSDDHKQGDLDIIAEGIIQQPNLSQG